MKKIIFMAVLTLWVGAAVASPAVIGEITWEEAQASPICDVRDAKEGILRGKGVLPGQDVLVEMSPVAGRNSPRCRANGADVVKDAFGVLRHRICHNRIVRLWRILPPTTTPPAVAWQSADRALLGLAVDSVSTPELASTRMRVEAIRATGRVAAALVGAAGQVAAARARRPDRWSIQQVGGGATATAEGGNASAVAVADATSTATGGAGGTGGTATTTVAPPPPGGPGGTPPNNPPPGGPGGTPPGGGGGGESPPPGGSGGTPW